VVRVIICLLAILLSLNSYALTKVSATVDKNPIVVNESLILTVIADDDIDSNALDTSPLLSDFMVGRTSVSSQTSMINFKTTRTTTWTTVLIARKPGEFVIPAFDVNGVKSQTIEIKALAADNATATSQQDLFITTQVSAREIYVQQQITLTVKLHFSAELKRGSLTEPTLAGANILQIGKDKESENIINGKRYRIIERIYAISPQQSGDVLLKSPVFSGEIIMPSSRRSNFLSFADSKPVSVIGDDISLTVKPIPTQIDGSWLPSELVALHQEWQPAPAQFHTGLNNERLVSQKVANFAIVASQPGEYLLPDITIPWWNTVTNKAEIATIPGQKITILPNADLAPIPVEQTAATNLEKNIAAPTPETVIIEQNSFLQWLFLALWLLTSLAWYISAKRSIKHSAGSNEKNTKRSSTKISNAHLSILAACRQNNGELALATLLPWAQSKSSENDENITLTTIDSVLAYFNDKALSEAVIELQQSCYGKNKEPWSGNSLLNAIQALHKKSPKTSQAIDIKINP